MAGESGGTVLRSPWIASEASAFSGVTRIGEGAGPPAAIAGCPTWSPVRAVAHSAQNLAAGGFSHLHFGHRRRSAVAHWMQNFAPSGFSAEQFWQRIDLSVGPATRSITPRRKGASAPVSELDQGKVLG